jgi:hypothetical protein
MDIPKTPIWIDKDFSIDILQENFMQVLLHFDTDHIEIHMGYHTF